MAKKTVDSVDMDFTANATTEETAESPKVADGPDTETFEHEGKVVYKRDKNTKVMQFFDQEGNEIGTDVLDKLESAYPKPPPVGEGGSEPDGQLTQRFTKEVMDEETKGLKTIDVPYEECEYIVETQNYKNSDGTPGTPFTRTIPKKFNSLVKVLRGEIG